MEMFLGILAILGCIAFIIFVIYCTTKQNKRDAELLPEYESFKEKYDKLISEYEKKNALSNFLNEYILIDKESIKILNGGIVSFDLYKTFKAVVPSGNPEEKYLLDDIKYYELVGSLHKEQNISGGGSSIKGAVAGGLIAGGTGAIIGSRKGIETTYNEVDDREVIVTFKDEKKLELDKQCYEILLDYIPEKEYDNYIQNKKKKGIK